MDMVTIREATLEDKAILLEFEQGVIQAERPFNPNLKVGEIQYYDIPELISSPSSAIFLAEIDAKPIGSAYARIEVAKSYFRHSFHTYLGFMYVLPEFRVCFNF
ncbi:MAG: hypothetical protein AAF849_15715 [Bacteroidota bacterium]